VINLKVLIAGAECAPFIKVGGLADVLGSLPKYLKRQDVDVATVIPFYRGIDRNLVNPNEEEPIKIQTSNGELKFGVHKSIDHDGVVHYFLSHEQYFGRTAVYGEPDDAERFFAFSMAVVALAQREHFDLLHTNDWHTAVIPVLIRNKNLPMKTLFTIHNLAYQGLCSSELGKFLMLSPQMADAIEQDEVTMNPMKGGILFADYVSTVSPTYAREILTPDYGMGLDLILAQRKERLVGILNGIDVELYNPLTDPNIYRHYGHDWDGKYANTVALRKELGLDDGDYPVFGLVSRFVEQKGIDLVAEAMDSIVAMGGEIAALGTGDKKYEELLSNSAKKYPGRVSVNVTFDPVLAQRIYAGSTHFLMPSRFEPCGLGQMIALRYGSLPVVRRTGGLADTVIDVSTHLDGNGFVFDQPSTQAFLKAVGRAVSIYRNDKSTHLALFERALSTDVSWDKSARSYVELYEKILQI
jgi:starch synthase